MNDEMSIYTISYVGLEHVAGAKCLPVYIVCLHAIKVPYYCQSSRIFIISITLFINFIVQLLSLYICLLCVLYE